MELFLLRHGQTDYNAEKRFQGRVDVPLNQLGKSQALKMRDQLLADLSQIAQFYTSPLCRAKETAQLIAPDPSIVKVDGRLIEIDLGEFDGRLETDIEQDLGTENYDAWRRANFVQGAPGGESLSQAMRRAESFLQDIVSAHGHEKIAIVSHQGFLIALKSVISGDSTRQALTRYRQRNDEIEVWSTENAGLIHKICIVSA